MKDQPRYIRPPIAAGVFYPADPNELVAMVRGYIKSGIEISGERKIAPRALIAPHGGYSVAGKAIAAAYTTVGDFDKKFARIVILSPSHQLALRGFALPTATAFSTPCGQVGVDPSCFEMLKENSLVSVSETAHKDEFGIEVHLPFVLATFSDIPLVPIVAGAVSGEEVKELLDMLKCGPETLIVVSSDLSHYFPIYETERLDKQTSKFITELTPERMDRAHACGSTLIQGLLLFAKENNYQADELYLCNTAELTNNSEQVVGYGSFVFLPNKNKRAEHLH